ncbi:MAG: phosphoribosyl-AMP cyclohydrolase, partial [Chloroflexota bacterium]|nr:phosphoribosyl-AMP cyclohydrolase [Chloroflexota bacterium]
MTNQISRNQWLKMVKFDAAGLVPVIVQDATTHQVLMMAW